MILTIAVLNADDNKFQSGHETIEDLSKLTVAQTSTVVSNAGEIYPSQCLDDCPTHSEGKQCYLIYLFQGMKIFLKCEMYHT